MRAVAKTVLNRIQGVRARRSLRAAERAIAAGKIMLAAAKYAEAAARAQAETSLLRRVRKTAGKNLLKAGAPRDAMAHLYAVAEWSPEDADNLRRLTRAASQTDDAATEIFAWRALLKCEPENLKAHRRLAKLYYAHAPEMAAPHLEAVAAAASGWTENWRRLARVRSMTDDFGGEADAWRGVLENEPGDREAHERLAELVWDPKNAAAALPHLEALADAPSDNCEFWERLARARADAGDRAGEVAAWRRFLRASRYSFVAHRRIGALMMAKGAPDMAAPHLNAAAALAPGKESILEMRAEACRALNDCDGEIDALSKLTALKPHDAAVVQRLGALLMKDGRFAAAVDAFRRAAANGADDPESRRQLARALEAADADAAAIIDAWRDVLAGNSDDAEAHERLSVQLYACGQWADVIPHLQKIAANRPDDRESRIALARALDAAGDAREQIEAWREVLSLDENDPFAHRRLADLLEKTDPGAALAHLEFLITQAPDGLILWRRIATAAGTAGEKECEMRAWLRIVELHARDMEAHRRLAEIYYAAGKLVETARHLNAWIGERDRDQDAWIRLAQVRERLEDTDGALDAWRRAAALGSLDAETNVKVGALFRSAGRLEEAVSFLEAALEADGDNGPVLRKLARTCRAAGMERAEIDAWRRLLAVEPDDAIAHRRLGDLFSGLKENDKAAPHLKHASDAAPGNLRLARRLAHSGAATGNVDNEIVGWRRVLDQKPDDEEAPARLARLLYDQKKLAEAAPHLKRASDADPSNKELASRLARACRKVSDPAGEILALERIVACAPGDITARRRLSALYDAAGDTDCAIEHLESVIAEKPGQPSLWRKMAALRRVRNDVDGEIAALSALLALEPDNARGHARCGLLLFKRRADAEAAEHLQAAARATPDDLSLWRKLARCFRNIGNTEREAETLEEILQRSDGDLDARRRLTAILPRLERAQDALDHLRVCVRLAPESVADQRAFAEALSATPDSQEEAVAAWTRLLELTPGDRQAQLRLADLYLQAERGEAAEAIYDTLTTSFPEDAALWKKRAQAARMLHGPQAEVDILRSAAAVLSEPGPLLYALAELQIERGDDAAAETARAAWDAHPDPARYGGICNKLVRAHRTCAAASGYAMLVRETPESPAGWSGLGDIMLRTERYRRASAYFAKAYEITGNYADCKRWIGSLVRGEQFETVDVNRIILEDPRNNRNMLAQYAQALAGLGRYEEALEMAEAHYRPAEEILRDGFLHYLKVRLRALNDGDGETAESSDEKIFLKAEELQASGDLRAAARLYAKSGARLHRYFAHRTDGGVDVKGPDFLIIGAPRSGSSWLKNCLKRHPQLRVANGEPSYFTAYVRYSPVIYAKWFATIKHARPNDEDGVDRSAPLFGEKTREYLTMSDETIALCAALYPNVRLICVARDPVERAWSHLKHRRLAARDPGFYRDDDGALPEWLLKVLEYGRYERNLKRWAKHFPPEQLFVADFNRIRTDPLELLSEVQTFLSVRQINFSDLSFNEKNFTGATTAGGPSPEVEQLLADFYSEEPFNVNELRRAIGAAPQARPKSSKAA